MDAWVQLNNVLDRESLRKDLIRWILIFIGCLILAVSSFFTGKWSDDTSKLLRQLSDSIRVLDSSRHQLTEELKKAHKLTIAAKPAVEKGREEVVVLSPSTLRIYTTPSSTEDIQVPEVVARALEAERIANDAKDLELEIAYDVIQADSAGIKLRDQKIEVLERERKCKVFWVVPCPSRKQAYAAGAVTVTVVKVALTLSKRAR